MKYKGRRGRCCRNSTHYRIICGDETVEDYDNITQCHIRSIEDLVAFSSLVNSGKTFEGKIVYLDKDLNMENIDNFQPIGAKATPFKGIFEGNAYTISKLMINRPDEDNVGLFGYITGTGSSEKAKIVGLNVENVEVKGNNYVGGLVGYLYSNSEVNEVTVSGKVEGKQYVGGITGYGNTATLTSVISNVNVSGSKYVGGLAGQGTATFNGIIESGTIIGNDYVYGSGRSISNAYINEKVNIESTGSNKGIGGTAFPEESYNDLEYYADLKISSKVVIETPTSGDTDNSGYYFDYNEDGTDIIVVKAENSQ